MEEYDYDIEYVKGKEKKVADCLSQSFPITSDISKQAMWEAGISDEEDGTALLKTQPQKIEVFGTPVITEDKVLKREENINLPPRKKERTNLHDNLKTWHAYGIYKLETATHLRQS